MAGTRNLDNNRYRHRVLGATCVRLREFTPRPLTADGGTPGEIVRQRWDFNPPRSTSELEDYEVNLDGVSALQSGSKSGPDKQRSVGISPRGAWPDRLASALSRSEALD
jgi:hypothetical protein